MLKTVLKVLRGNKLYSYPVTLNITDTRIEFINSPFGFKDEIKAFRGARWHGFDKERPRKIWSIENHPRNCFQLKALMGEPVYDWWEQPLIDGLEFNPRGVKNLAPLPQQQDMIRRGLTYHFHIMAAEQGLGKSLSAIEIMERSGKKNWWYVGPLSALESFQLEMVEWKIDPSIEIECMTYEALVSRMRYDFDGLIAPDGIILDEISACKTATSHRTIAAQAIADLIREQHGFDGYVIGLSGTPTAKHPTDIWAQAEIVWPGFLREGNYQAFERRYAIMEEQTDLDGVAFMRRTGWNEDEVNKIHGRLEGLMTVYRKKDWLTLPEKKYRTVRLTPDSKVLRVARTLCHVAPNTITALTWTRALSSGFQYVTKKVGDKECPVCRGEGTYDNPTPGSICPACAGAKLIAEYDRETVKVKSPKDNALRDLLDECDTHGRIVIAASFQGSIDRIFDICKERGWATCVVDGRGWRVYDCMGKLVKDSTVMEFWTQHKGKVAFVGNPGSCRFGLTLTLAYMLVFYDNNFSAEHRLQMEDRIHRMSMDETLGAIIVDLVHLPVDQLVIDTLKANKKLELLSLGVVNESIGIGEDTELTEELLELIP